MNVYIITAEEYDYDEAIAFVLVAPSIEVCRLLAAKHDADLHISSKWEKAKVEKVCSYTGKKKKPFIILGEWR